MLPTATIRAGAISAIVACALVAGVGASGAPGTTKQRIAITETHRIGTGAGRFRLLPLTAGVLDLDSGTVRWADVKLRRRVLSGQIVESLAGLARLTGARGTLTIRWRAEEVSAGSSYKVERGTWSIARGTGAYEGATGSGGLGAVVPPARAMAVQFEGLVTIP